MTGWEVRSWGLVGWSGLGRAITDVFLLGKRVHYGVRSDSRPLLLDLTTPTQPGSHGLSRETRTPMLLAHTHTYPEIC